MVNQKSEAQPETTRPDFFGPKTEKTETSIKKFKMSDHQMPTCVFLLLHQIVALQRVY